jgi:hypothetical protein
MFSGEVLDRNQAQFAEIFGRRLRDFYIFPCGFDVVAFDQWLEVPMDGQTSARSFIVDHYGEEAAELIENLL